jgi:uncharacterized protein with ACT and thioredoxin-like domain
MSKPQKKSSKFTHVDDVMTHNLVKYHVQFDFVCEIKMKVSLDKIFYNVVIIHDVEFPSAR